MAVVGEHGVPTHEHANGVDLRLLNTNACYPVYILTLL